MENRLPSAGTPIFANRVECGLAYIDDDQPRYKQAHFILVVCSLCYNVNPILQYFKVF